MGRYQSGFVGCIDNVTLATDYRLDMLGEADMVSDVHQCHTSDTVSHVTSAALGPVQSGILHLQDELEEDDGGGQTRSP